MNEFFPVLLNIGPFRILRAEVIIDWYYDVHKRRLLYFEACDLHVSLKHSRLIGNVSRD